MPNYDFAVNADDPDAHVLCRISDANGSALDFAATVRVGTTTEVTATWTGSTVASGDGSTSRVLDVPLNTIPVGTYTLWLEVPGDNDLYIGAVRVR